ncbi:MAG: HAMP domain-containing histidine kinase [Planctomycetes bacterium]|nr:HAMP domain-containing histidine kinase [Planctomycetota bacterium]
MSGDRAATDPPPGARAPEQELSPWSTAPLLWLRRLVSLRLYAFIPLVGLCLAAAQQGRLARGAASPLFSAILAAAFLNLLLFLASRRLRAGATAAALAGLWASLFADCLLVLLLAHVAGGVASPLSLFLLLPVLAAAVATPERATLALAAAASAALIAAFAWEAEARGQGGALAAMLALLWIVTLGTSWYRRRGRFLERRLALLEEERAALGERVQAARVLAGAAAAAGAAAPGEARDGAGPVGAVAGALAADLLEPTGVVRARTENVRFQLREQRELRGLVLDLERVLQAADRLDDARLTLVELARLDPAPEATTDARAVAQSVRDALAREFEREGLRLRIDCPARLPRVVGSHNEVRLILVRLLDAARRAARAGGRAARISARLWREEDRVILCVDDPFPALEPSEEWFDPAWTWKERPALGLALAVVRTIARRRGGDVSARRRSKGGLSVQVVLRVAGRDGAAGRAGPEAGQGAAAQE